MTELFTTEIEAQGIDTEYEAFVADIHPKFGKTGCSSGEALCAQRNPLCPERVGRQDYPDGCQLHSGICLKETGEPCSTYQEFILKLNEGEES